jgi:hypothetical protein
MAGETTEALERALRRGPQTAAQLLAALRVSQPTLSRALRGLGPAATSFRIRGERAPRYALLRRLPLGLHSRQRISRVLSAGSIEPFAEVEFLAGGGTLERIRWANRLYAGLPPYMAFAAPSGFLGRQVAQGAAQSEPGFPENLRDWSEDHRVAFLFTRGLNLPGNLVFGEGPLQRELDLRQLRPTSAADRLHHYEALASALRETAYGSSAGGEQPKFLAAVEDVGHVIVKFAKRGSRMAELLPMEHLALEALGSVGVPASRTKLLASAAPIRSKRWTSRKTWAAGRSVDDEFFGQRESWPQFAARCVQERYISAGDARCIDIMAAFSELIGNNDRHYENISLLIGDDGEYAGVAPAYDILPMRYATLGGGVDPELTPINPMVGTIGAQPQVWDAAATAAEAFWTAVQKAVLAAPISRPFRELAAANREVARAFVAPLLPAARSIA